MAYKNAALDKAIISRGINKNSANKSKLDEAIKERGARSRATEAKHKEEQRLKTKTNEIKKQAVWKAINEHSALPLTKLLNAMFDFMNTQ